MRFRAILLALLLAGCGQATEPPTQDPVANNLAATAPEQYPEQVAEPTEVAPPAAPSGPRISACLIQDGERIAENALRALGTEPFWAANVQGRCVTYSTPENQAGVRIWTKFEGTSENGQWTGTLDRQPFVMVTRPQAGCSDGMSDNRYPIAVTLTVRGEQRTGCAEPR